MTIGIPDQPTDADISRVLSHLVWAAKISWVSVNREECERLRGTPGEPIPVVQPNFTECLRWEDAFGFDHLRQEAMSTGCAFITAQQIRS